MYVWLPLTRTTKFLADPKKKARRLAHDIIAEECDQDARPARRPRSRWPLVPLWVGAGGLVLVLAVTLVVVLCSWP